MCHSGDDTSQGHFISVILLEVTARFGAISRRSRTIKDSYTINEKTMC